MAKKGDSENSAEVSTRSSRRRMNRSHWFILAAAIAVIAVILVYNSRTSAPVYNGGGGIKVPNLMLQPSSQKVSLSSPLSVRIWANTGNHKVNAVQANLSYPIDKLNFVNVDGAGSAFGLAVRGTGDNGKVTIARGSFQPVTGKLLVATVNFTAANNNGVASVKFAADTTLISATTNKNILAGTYGGNYNLSP